MSKKAQLFVATLLIGAICAAGTIVPTYAMTDAELRAYQAKYLDPQAETHSTNTTTHHHSTLHAPTAALPADSAGQWSNLPPLPAAFNAIHSIAGPNGKYLLVAGSGNSSQAFLAGTFKTYVWVPATGAMREVPTPEDLFCAGHVLLPDGRALVGGGTTAYSPFKGSKGLYAFNFRTEIYEKMPSMQVGRWYPSIVTAADGRSLIIAGIDENGLATRVNEVFDYRTNTVSALPGLRQFPLYPHITLASNGKYFYTGGGSGSSTLSPGFWQPFAGNTYQNVPGLRLAQQRAASASCFVGDVRNQRMMVMGGGWPATNYTDVVKLNATSPLYSAGPPLRAPKAYVSCVNLPDGKLFEANGGTSNTVAGASTEAALLSSHTSTWQAANSIPAGEHRVYHSMLFLLDDGRVVSMTSNPNSSARSTSVLAYSPPYLYKGTRPVITTAPTEVRYGASYAVAARSSGGTVKRYAITTPPSPTHSSEPNQRYLELRRNDAGKITIPSSPNILPPGWYRLWAVDSQGRVSVAKWIHLS